MLLDRVLPYLGPGIALVLGLAGLGHRALDLADAAAVAAATGPFTEVVERALSDDPARAGYVLLQPVVAWSGRDLGHDFRPSRLRSSPRSPPTASGDGSQGGTRAPRRHWCSHRRSVSSHSRARSGRSLSRSPRSPLECPVRPVRGPNAATPSWWAVYAASAAVLPLTHPVAASALAAQVLALVVARREWSSRLAVPAVAIATLESLFFLTMT